MAAEKIVKINTDYEADMLRERVNTLESVITYSVAETVQVLKNENQQLKDEAIALKSANYEKDKLITEQKNMIAYIQTDVEKIAEIKASKIIKDIRADYERQLTNAKSNGSRPVSAENKALKESLLTQQEMYNSLLADNAKTHKNQEILLDINKSQSVILDKLYSKLEDIYSLVDKLVNGDTTLEEVNKQVEISKKSLQENRILDECIRIHSYLETGYSRTEVANIMYPELTRRLQKVKERIDSKTYQDMYVNLK